MAKDYVLYIHGVNTREQRESPNFADALITRVAEQTLDLEVVPLPLYWGDVNQDEEQRLLARFRASKVWDQMWFRSFRELQMLQFAGDAVLYISRYVGSGVIKALHEQAIEGVNGQPGLKELEPGDRLHLVSHSMGTVILFDGLFAARWDQPDIPAHAEAQQIRSYVFGLEPQPGQGLRLASLHTMGSPVAIFSLMNVTGSAARAAGRPAISQAEAAHVATHDVTPQLQRLLKSLGHKIPWVNYIHPGDPVAFPLDPLMYDLVDDERQYLDVEDVLATRNDLLGTFIDVAFDQSTFALLNGGKAHNSYWDNPDVAARIARSIRSATRVVQPSS